MRSGSPRKTVPSWLSIRPRVIHRFNAHSRTYGQLLYGEITIDPAKLKMREPLRVFLHESGQYPSTALYPQIVLNKQECLS